MSNPAELQRRSRQLGENNRQASAREKSSLTAKKTSSRPEILAQRSENLSRWRREKPEEFQRALAKSLCIRVSLPERILYSLISSKFKGTTRQHMIVHQDIPNSSKRARIDIAIKDKGILIEFDGPSHFIDRLYGPENLELRRQRDHAVELYTIENGMTLIRIAHSQFIKKKFLDSCIQEVIAIIENPTPGVYYFGEEYKNAKNNNRPDASVRNDEH
jgi:hypothetical protein